MATLFLARRSGAAGFAKHVAIKVVHSHLATDERFVQMFVDEALLSARIHHPNVVHVEELGEMNGTYYLVMEYVHGCSLAQLMKALAMARRRMLPELAVNIAIGVADGLHAAHETVGDDRKPLGVVHRDVTPDNVLLAFKGHVKVIDFGVAKARERSQQTTAGTLKGKFAYMAPEQAKGLAVDRRTDVYALGICLWEALTMRRCFKAPTDLGLLDLVRDPKIPPPSSLAPGITPALDAAVMCALSPNIEDRPATAQAFRRLLADAAPRALAMDASHLADLLATVMNDEIARERASIPDSVSEVISPGATMLDQDEVLKTLTVDNTDLEHPANVDKPLDVMDSGDAAAAALGATTSMPSGDALAAPPPAFEQAPTPVTQSGGGNKRWALIGGGVLIVLAGVGFAVGGSLMGGDESTSHPIDPPPVVASPEPVPEPPVELAVVPDAAVAEADAALAIAEPDAAVVAEVPEVQPEVEARPAVRPEEGSESGRRRRRRPEGTSPMMQETMTASPMMGSMVAAPFIEMPDF